MKKFIFTLFAVACFSSTFAQGKIDAGIRLSPIITSTASFDASGKKLDGYGGRMGFIASLMMNYNFTDNFGLHTGLGYKMNGYKTKSPLADTTFSINAVEIPIALRLRTPEIGGSTGIHIRALVGPNFDINTSGQANKNLYKGYTPVNIGIFGGLGIDWTIEKVGMFDLGLRYNNGMVGIRKNSGDARQTLSYWGLDLGYYFNWGN